MPKAPKFDESRMLEACAAAQALEKPNITKVAREYGVPMRTLRNRVLNITRARTERIPVNKTLETHQEKALMQRVADLRELNMPVTSQMIVEWANQALARSGKRRRRDTKRQVRPLSQIGVWKRAMRIDPLRYGRLKILLWRRKDDPRKQWENVYGKTPAPTPIQENRVLGEAARAANRKLRCGCALKGTHKEHYENTIQTQALLLILPF